MGLLPAHAKKIFVLGYAAGSATWYSLHMANTESKPRKLSRECRTVVALPVEPLNDAAPNQKLIKQWNVFDNSPSSPKAPTLQLAVSVPTLISVRRSQEASSDASPVVRVEFSGDNKLLLEAIEVDAHKQNMLRVGLDPSTRVHGSLMGEIVLGPGVPLTALSLHGDVALVIRDDNVLAEAPQDVNARVHPFQLNLLGDAQVFVSLPTHAKAIRLESFTINSMGDGMVQLDVPSLQVDNKMDINAKGAGDIVLHSKHLQARGRVTTNMMGTGSVRVAAAALHVAKRLQVNIWGDGRVYFGAKAIQSSCPKAKLWLWGDAHVDLGALQCTTAAVQIRGDADVALQVIDRLQVQASPNALVQVVGEFPAKVESLATQRRHPLLSRQAADPAASTSQADMRCRVVQAVDYEMQQDPSECGSYRLKALPAQVPVQVRADQTGWLRARVSKWLI